MAFEKTTDIKELRLAANSIRRDIVEMITAAGSGHPAGSLGLADVFSALFFGVMEHDPQNPGWEGRDRFVLSNGHVCPVLYSALAETGYFPKEELITLRKMGSRLQGHPHKGALPGIENSSGPLGQGLPIAVGMALVAKREGRPQRAYCVVSDGEQQEGQIWEAAMLAAKYKLSNLIVTMDRNYIQIDGSTMEVNPLDPISDKYRAFNWNVIEVDGHDMEALLLAYSKAQKEQEKPTMIIARTVPGKGVPFMEGLVGWHGKAPKEDDAQKAYAALEDERKKITEGA
ncbi:transketolase [Candidatus Micrarchaeota archaeon]|nr:transketolase [Candidatus Micrarchaeota archaeon]